MKLHELTTPALVIDTAALNANIDTMAAERPGNRLRPHVKAFKSTDMALHVAGRGGHNSFCCATLREMEGMAEAGLGNDLLLANETLDTERLQRLAGREDARVTVAVDSPETVAAAASTAAEVLVDVDVGLPRCGCLPSAAGDLGVLSLDAGLSVRGVMGYEGHTVGNPSRADRIAEVEQAMSLLRSAQAEVGGITSAGATGTFDMHHLTDEVQAGSYLLMDSHYANLELPFVQALTVLATVISVSPKGWAVADCGLKSLGMDHGEPTIPGYDVFFCSDEHTTFLAVEGSGHALPRVGERLLVIPAHVDPTVAYHERFNLVAGLAGADPAFGAPDPGFVETDVIDAWPVDLRGW